MSSLPTHRSKRLRCLRRGGWEKRHGFGAILVRVRTCVGGGVVSTEKVAVGLGSYREVEAPPETHPESCFSKNASFVRLVRLGRSLNLPVKLKFGISPNGPFAEGGIRIYFRPLSKRTFQKVDSS